MRGVNDFLDLVVSVMREVQVILWCVPSQKKFNIVKECIHKMFIFFPQRIVYKSDKI